MSILSSFFSAHLIPALEAALVSHEPEVQDAILSEIELLVGDIADWIKDRWEVKPLSEE